MTSLLVDTSVVLKWYHAEGESDVDAARRILDAHTSGRVAALVLDLAFYELGNVLLRSLRWSAEQVADQLDDLQAMVGTPLVLTPAWRRQAARLGERNGLTMYDAAWAATAAALDISLVSADRRLLAAGLAEDPAAIAATL